MTKTFAMVLVASVMVLTMSAASASPDYLIHIDAIDYQATEHGPVETRNDIRVGDNQIGQWLVPDEQINQ